MPIGPEGVVVGGSALEDETGGAVGGAGKETEGRGGAGVRPHKDRRPRSPGPIDELIEALREATLGPVALDVMDLIHFQIQGPESKFNPLFLKESQVKDLMLICWPQQIGWMLCEFAPTIL